MAISLLKAGRVQVLTSPSAVTNPNVSWGIREAGDSLSVLRRRSHRGFWVHLLRLVNPSAATVCSQVITYIYQTISVSLWLGRLVSLIVREHA